jgi:TalC/MipB family fructose-6-phosphate aldolase
MAACGFHESVKRWRIILKGGERVRLYLDTADRTAAESLLATGLFRGITTNPTILQRAAKGVSDIKGIYRWAIGAGAEEVFFQAWGDDAATLFERGQWLRDLGQEVVVKFVATRAGATACAALAARGTPTLLTAIYDPGQAIVAAAAGATYIAPYLGRLNDAGRQGIAEVIAMHEVLVATGSTTKVLLASIRSVPDMVALARHGVDCFTMAPAVAEQFFTDPTTADAARTFEQAVRETSA